jgi:hypothetical protein
LESWWLERDCSNIRELSPWDFLKDFKIISGKMKKSIALLCLSLASLSMYAQDTKMETQSPKFTPADVMSDLDTCYRILRESAYNLYVSTAKNTYDADYQKIRALLKERKDSVSQMEASRIFQGFAVMARLAHLGVDNRFVSSYDYYKAQGGTLFPFGIRIEGEKGYVKDNYSGNQSIALGDEVLTINGKPFKDYLTGIYALVSGENDYYKSTSVDIGGFPKSFWEAYGEVSTFRIRIKKGGTAREIDMVVSAIPAIRLDKVSKGIEEVLHFYRIFRIINKQTAYYQPGIFINLNNGGGTSSHETFETGEFIRFLDSAFLQIHLQHIQNLIIDLRGNPGGDNSFSDPMVAYFATRSFWFCSRFSVKTSALTKKFWAGVTDTTLKDIRAAILSHPDGEIFDTPIPSYPPRTDSLKFTGHVYILINRHSFSNATTTPALIQDYHFGKIVGETTADCPTLYAAEHDFTLPKTHMIVTYPKAYIVRPNGSTSPSGVVPDYPFKDDELGAADKALNYTLQLIAENKY